MAQLYRKTALEKISSPEQLDKALKVTSPLSWLALVGITLIIVVAIVWSIVGTIPVTVTAQGIIAAPTGTNAVYAEGSGKVVSILVHPGMEVHLGDPVLRYQTETNEMIELTSDQVGTVSEILVAAGDSVSQGNEVLRISPAVSGKQVAVCYLPLSQVKKLERAMQVQIYIDSVDSQSYGHIVARVINIDSFASTSYGISHVVGSDNSLASLYQQNGPVVAVTCEFYPGETKSGYYWTNEKGNEVTVTNGSSITAKIVTEEIAPITKLFSDLKDLWGD